ncbi:hypothetical protein GTR02_17305 [Kineococcus sp. R8]|uniref:hypothetical protein n=1 Tax=Kineococcus siccus TaxID=2696567 RepID=UPI001411D9F5|nr:hypothetical protein [Kineococcus siccus]NAZ83572.1 hypothetical protein [Kineococcus siccus]
MQGLLGTLSMLEADADPAARVAGFFDTVRRRESDLAGVLRATAALAQCVVGLDDPRAGTSLRVAPDGRLLAPRAGHDGPRVWLERDPAGPLDALLLQHLARAVEHRRSARHRSADVGVPGEGPPAEQALAQVVLSSAADDGERARAALQLGLRADAGVQVVAVAGGGAADLVTRVAERVDAVRWAQVGGVDALLLQGGLLRPGDLVGEATTAGTRTVPTTAAAALAWPQARVALRFAAAGLHGTSDDRLVSHEELGALAALATVPGDVARSLPDVRALGELGGRPGGRGLLATLAAVCRTRSHRAAAVQLHLHHSSIAGRLAHAERALGFTLDGDHAITRAQTALLLHHLHAAPG